MGEGVAFISNSLRYNTTTILSASFLVSTEDGCDSRMNATSGLFSWTVELLAVASREQVVSCTKPWTYARALFELT